MGKSRHGTLPITRIECTLTGLLRHEFCKHSIQRYFLFDFIRGIKRFRRAQLRSIANGCRQKALSARIVITISHVSSSPTRTNCHPKTRRALPQQEPKQEQQPSSWSLHTSISLVSAKSHTKTLPILYHHPSTIVR